MKYTIINLTTLERVDCVHNSEVHFLDEVQLILEDQWDLEPARSRVSWAYPFLRGETVLFRTKNGGAVRVWQNMEGIWVKEI